jgi:iron complex transport system ATP-binding protein
MSEIIKVEKLGFCYTHGTLLKNISFELPRGTFLTIAGPNGAGKTTLLNLLCRLLRPDSGVITIDGANITAYSVKKLAQKIAVVRQEFIPVFDFTVAQLVSMGRTPYMGTFGFESKSDSLIVEQALIATDTIQFALRPVGKLSGGERQRVFIARALAQQTPALLLDEPTSFLDLKHQVRIYDLLKKMQLEKGKTIVSVTHDINLALQYADVALLLGADGSYQFGKARDVFSEKQIEKVFSVKIAAGTVGQEKIFMPLGEFSSDRYPKE